MPAHLSVRKTVAKKVKLHHKQVRWFRGKRYCVSKIFAHSGIAAAVRKGFKEILVKGKWAPIASFQSQGRGGDRVSQSFRSRGRGQESVRTRPRHKPNHWKQSQWDVKYGEPRDGGPQYIEPRDGGPHQTFLLSETCAFVANLPTDAVLRVTACRELETLGFLSITVPRGVVGKELVRESLKTANKSVCELTLTAKGKRALGQKKILFRTKNPQRAVNALGCTLTHKKIWTLIGKANAMHALDKDSFSAVFEDDIYLGMPGAKIKHLMQTMLSLALAGPIVPDIIYLHTTSPQCVRPLKVAGFPNCGG